ncbi:unnamed protein product [Amoebophrya sp. A25]|nr:unnamed protein product [Amoebophrya sp. A25]|eukprot:GSA25T00018379001.1
MWSGYASGNSKACIHIDYSEDPCFTLEGKELASLLTYCCLLLCWKQAGEGECEFYQSWACPSAIT